MSLKSKSFSIRLNNEPKLRKLFQVLLETLTLDDIEELKKRKQEQLGILKPKPKTEEEQRKEKYPHLSNQIKFWLLFLFKDKLPRLVVRIRFLWDDPPQ